MNEISALKFVDYTKTFELRRIHNPFVVEVLLGHLCGNALQFQAGVEQPVPETTLHPAQEV